MPSRDELVIKITFGAHFTGYFDWWADEEFVYLSLSYAPDAELGEIPPFQTRVPRSLFADDEQIGEWAGKTWRKFEEWWTQAVYSETNQHFSDAANYYLSEMGLSSFSFEDMVKGREKASANNLKLRFKRPVGRGHRSKWTRLELLKAVQGIVAEKPTRTWEQVNKRLKQKYPGMESPSGKALSERARTFGILLRDVRREVAKSRVND